MVAAKYQLTSEGSSRDVEAPSPTPATLQTSGDVDAMTPREVDVEHVRNSNALVLPLKTKSGLPFRLLNRVLGIIMIAVVAWNAGRWSAARSRTGPLGSERHDQRMCKGEPFLKGIKFAPGEGLERIQLEPAVADLYARTTNDSSQDLTIYAPRANSALELYSQHNLQEIYQDYSFLVIGNSVIGRHFHMLECMLEGTTWDDKPRYRDWWKKDIIEYRKGRQFGQVWAFEGKDDWKRHGLCFWFKQDEPQKNWDELLDGTRCPDRSWPFNEYLTRVYKSYTKTMASHQDDRKQVVVIGGALSSLMKESWDEDVIDKIQTVLMPRLRGLSEVCRLPECRMLFFGELPVREFNFEESNCWIPRCVDPSTVGNPNYSTPLCSGSCVSEIVARFNFLVRASILAEFNSDAGVGIHFVDLSSMVEPNMVETDLVHWTPRMQFMNMQSFSRFFDQTVVNDNCSRATCH